MTTITELERDAHLSRLLAACAYADDFDFDFDTPLKELAAKFKKENPLEWSAYIKKYNFDRATIKSVYGVEP